MKKFQQRIWQSVLACGLGLSSAGSPVHGQANEQASRHPESRITLLQAKPRAYAIVEASSHSKQARVRLAGIEAAIHAPDAALSLARDGLVDDNPAVRFAALVTIGKLKLDRLSQAAIDLMRDDDISVRAAAIYAAKRCGRDIDLSPIGAMLMHRKGSVRANAAMLIGLLGDRQALAMLREMATTPMPRSLAAERTWVRLQFAEAIIRLNPDDEQTLSSIRASVYSNLEDIRILAIQILGDASDQSVLGGLAHIVQRQNPVQVKIAAAQSMLQLGDSSALPTIIHASRYDQKILKRDLALFLRAADGGDEVQAIKDILKDPKQQQRLAAEVRAQAARALGWSKSPEAATRLKQLIEDTDPIVQIAAAAAVLHAAP